MAKTPAILAEGLHKVYGKTHALNGLDLTVEEGSILGVLEQHRFRKSPEHYLADLEEKLIKERLLYECYKYFRPALIHTTKIAEHCLYLFK